MTARARKSVTGPRWIHIGTRTWSLRPVAPHIRGVYVERKPGESWRVVAYTHGPQGKDGPAFVHEYAYHVAHLTTAKRYGEVLAQSLRTAGFLNRLVDALVAAGVTP
jgi:hypothetical protein